MENLKKVVAVKDNDSHWYVIPAEMKDKFFELLEKSEYTETGNDWEQFEEEFIDTFTPYETGGDLNNVELYAAV